MNHLSPHPYEYPAAEVTDSVLMSLRRPHLPGCGHAEQAAATAGSAYVTAADLAAAAGHGGDDVALSGVCQRLGERQAEHLREHQPLGSQCRLLARKFLPHTVEAALAATAPCDSAARILNDGVCPGEVRAQAQLRLRWQRAAPLVLLSAALIPLAAALVLGGLAARPASGGGRRGS